MSLITDPSRYDLTFLKQYDINQDTADADFSVGSPLSTITVSRSASNPATFIDSNGVIQLLTTSNTQRPTQGYYDETGYHSAPSLLVEGTRTNLLKGTYFNVDTNSDDVGDYWTFGNNVSGTATYSLIANDIFGIEGAKTQKLDYTGISGDSGQYIDFLKQITVAGSVAQNDYVSFSIFMKGSLVGVNLGFVIDSFNDGTYLSTSSANFSSSVTSEWTRTTFTTELTDATVNSIEVKLVITGIGENDVIDLSVIGAQLEKARNTLSYIPTTTVALTRNQELPTYPADDGNFPDHLAGGTALGFDGTNDYVSVGTVSSKTDFSFICKVNFTTLSKNHTIWASKSTAGALTFGISAFTGFLYIKFFGVSTPALSTGALAFNTDYVVGVSHNGTTGDYNFYIDGVDAGSGNSGVVFSYGVGQIGGIGTSTNILSGFISYLKVYNTELSSSDFVTDFGGSNITLGQENWYDMTGLSFGATTLLDSIGSNDGTISGATVLGREHEGTLIMVYRPISMPDEQGTDFSRIFRTKITSSNEWVIRNGSNINDTVLIETRSEGSGKNASSTEPFNSIRNSLHSVIGTFSTTADGSGNKISLYVDGVLKDNHADYVIPVGILPNTFELLPTDDQGMMLVTTAISSRALTSSEVAEISTILTTIVVKQIFNVLDRISALDIPSLTFKPSTTEDEKIVNSSFSHFYLPNTNNVINLSKIGYYSTTRDLVVEENIETHNIYLTPDDLSAETIEEININLDSSDIQINIEVE